MVYRGAILAAVLLSGQLHAEVCNIKVVTDASPDYSDMKSMLHSITSGWTTDQEKCWAVFYWNHNGRRQTSPMRLHGYEVTDPIRQFNDYGYTMCSTMSGLNCSTWHHMGLPVKYYDVASHTVPEVFYDGRGHMYDNSLSAIYTLCDGKTIAGMQDLGKTMGCAASGGKEEPSHIVKYHCLHATSPNGFLEGADCPRDLKSDAHFLPNVLKHRYYYNNWDAGHRHIWNLKEGEVYTRNYQYLGSEPKFYVPKNGKDPEELNPRFRIRGNGVWRFSPSLKALDWKNVIHSARNVVAGDAGLRPEKAGAAAEIIYKIQSAHVTASEEISATFARKTANDDIRIDISTNNGIFWTEAWKAAETGTPAAKLSLVEQVSGSYETLIRITMTAAADPADACLTALKVDTLTQLNSKTQPKLLLGRNTIYVGAGDQTESIVFWPELQSGKYKEHIAGESNITGVEKTNGYTGALFPTVAKQDGFVIYKMEAPGDITRVTYGGRFYNRSPDSHIDLSWSADGKSWTKSWSLTDTKPPWDVLHDETIDIPKGNRAVWLKYLMYSSEASTSSCSIYAVRMEANYVPQYVAAKPMEVTFTWSEVQDDRKLVERSHTQLVEKLPFKYTINTGGADHPVVKSMTANLKGARGDLACGYSDGKDAGGEKFIGKWATYGRNLATGKKYTLSHPSETRFGAGDANGTKLTDGRAGSSYSGGTSYREGVIWGGDTVPNPVITLDLGAPVECASFGLHIHGHPGQDFLKGEVKDRIEVLVSDDGKDFKSIGFLKTDLRWKDLPVNFMWPDEETLKAGMARLVPAQPVTTRHVQFKINTNRTLCVTEIEVLDALKLEPFDLRIALPGEQAVNANQQAASKE
jgi:hypothetical protein